MMIYDILKTNASKTPDNPVIQAPGISPITNKHLLTHVNTTVETLKTIGIKKNYAIAVVLPDGPEMATVFLSIASCATCVPLNPSYKTKEFEYYFSHLSIQVLIVQAGASFQARDAAVKLDIPIIDLVQEADSETSVFTLHKNKPVNMFKSELSGLDDVALMLLTSGTTSRPKIVPHTHESLCISAVNVQKHLNLTHQDTCLNVMPMFHISGLLGSLLSSLYAGSSIICTPGFSSNDFFQWINTLKPTWYSAVPAMHRTILHRAQDHKTIPNTRTLRFIRSVADHIPADLIHDLESLFNIPVITTYGMTEAYQVTSNPLPPDLRKRGSAGVASGPEIEIRDETGLKLATGNIGEITVKGPNVIRGYAGHKAPDKESFANGWFRTGDQGYIDSDGYLFISGRLKEIINRAGEKIQPLEIDRLLQTHPAVKEAVTFGVPHEQLGEEIAAAVVLKKNKTITEKQLQEFTAAELADFKIPRQIIFLENFPMGATRKKQRMNLAHQLGFITETSASDDHVILDTQPITPTEKHLVTLWKRILNVPIIKRHDNFLDLGGDSLLAVKLLVQIKKEFGMDLPSYVFFKALTLKQTALEIDSLIRQPGKFGETNPDLNLHALNRSDRKSEDGKIPLSFAQQRLWFLNQLEPGSTFYNIPALFRLSGSLNIKALEKSLNHIIERHEILRTCFPETAGIVTQVVKQKGFVKLKIVDLGQQPAEIQKKSIRNLIHKDAVKPFELDKGPLFRCSLIQVNPSRHILILNMHHIISDGWSMGLLFKELTLCYNAYLKDDQPQLPVLPIQYRDFSIWQRKCFLGNVLDHQLSYWKKKLTGSPPVLELPTDYARPNLQTYNGESVSFQLSKELSHGLKKLSRDQGVTLFMTLMAAFKTLLHRYTGETDLLIGTPIAGRRWEEIEGLMGFFVNTLVMRTDFSGNPDFLELLRLVKETSLEAFAHQDIPFEKLVEELHPERSLSYSPLIQVMFTFQNVPQNELNLNHLKSEPIPLVQSTAKFDLSLTFTAKDNRLYGELNYNTDLFHGNTIQKMAVYFITLIEGILAKPDKPVALIPLLSDDEHHKIVVEWNKSKTDYPKDKCVHHLIEEWAEKTPDSIAVVFENETLTYRELNEKSNELASYLISLGVGPQTHVGICLERSPSMIVGILGILKAGGSYVPLDPQYPQKRLAFMLEDTQAPVLLTQKSLRDCLPAEYSGETVFFEEIQNLSSGDIHENPTTEPDPENLIYVMYTSGSTGSPKGVMISHGNVVGFLFGYRKVTSPADKRRVGTSIITFSFDTSVEEIFATLCFGGELHVLKTDYSMQPQKLARYIVEHHISHSYLGPDLLPGFSEYLENNPVNLRLRCLITGLMPKKQNVLQRIRNLSDDLLILNAYGPTEVTYGATAFDFKVASDPEKNTPIGVCFPNYNVYILDTHLQAVPVGVSGEMYISGVGNSRGYLNQPELTKESFITNPFSSDPAYTLYKTGDLARYLPDGNIDFLGRVDHQMKIRGFRIEPGEIETVLTHHSHIKEALIIAMEIVPRDKRLVAYLVYDGNSQPSVSSLRNHLKQSLPGHMIPAFFVFLDNLPLTPNGKIDRKALPKPDVLRSVSQNRFAPPRSPMEESIGSIWSEILGIPVIGIHDNFFDLGGHSLMATQVISRICTMIGQDISIITIFKQPTIASLADHIESYSKTGDFKALPIIKQTRQSDAIPLSFAQQRLWFLNQLEPGSAFYNIPAAWHITGILDIKALEKSMHHIIERHEILRTCFPETAGVVTQVVKQKGIVKLKCVDLEQQSSKIQKESIRNLINEDVGIPFDLDTGPLFRSTLLKLSSSHHILILNMHHIISDGWSMGIFFKELSLFYNAYLKGNPPRLQKLPVQYRDFSQWQRQTFQGEMLNVQLSYWKNKLTGSPSILELPTDRPRPAVQTFHGAVEAFHFPKNLSDAVKILSTEHGCTLFMTLLTAFKIILFRHSGQEEILIGSPIAGRNREEIEGLIGFFANTLVLRSDLSGNPAFLDVLKQVKETSLEAYNHQDLPFEQLVEALQPDRNLSTSPLFQVLFVFQNAAMHDLKFSGLTLEPMKIKTGTSKFDLLLSMSERSGEIRGVFEYNTDLYDASTIERLKNQFTVLIQGITKNPDQPITQLPLLTDTQQEQIISKWNETTSPQEIKTCVHHLFEKQVEQTPGAIAVIFEDEEITYRELNHRSNQVAHYLIASGITPDTPVGISVSRSMEMIIGVLGILKSGGAYVPLDPEFPEKRIAYILEDTGIRLVLTHSHLSGLFRDENLTCVFLDAGLEDTGNEHLTNPITGVTVNNLVYILYTSGSTGNPKGVALPHRTGINLILWEMANSSITKPARMLQFSPLNFDVSFTDIFMPLCSGGAIVVPSQAVRLDIPAIINFIYHHEIERLNLPFIVLQYLAEEAVHNIEKLKSVKEIISTAEQLKITQPIRKMFFHLPGCVLQNQYGPSETHVVTSLTLPEDIETWDAVPSIGRPINNTRIYILDQQLNVVPIGVYGELHIAGAGLASHYVNLPELTDKKFIPDPFSNIPGERLYKTGDYARYHPDGTIEYLGRMDFQVKIRGFRIELGEIEAVLGQHSAIKNVTLIAYQHTGDNRLAAYIVFKQGRSASTTELRAYLKKSLPDYMLPFSFIPLDSLPVTPNGKVDRKALPEPWTDKIEPLESQTAPRSPIEEILAEIWQHVLGQEQIGIHDNFFDLGGHSLLATQVISRIRNLLQKEISVITLFKLATIADMAEHIESLGKEGTGPALPIIKPVMKNDILPLSFAQQRLWFLDQLEPNSAFYNIPAAWYLTGILDIKALKKSMHHIIERHGTLRTCFPKSAGVAAQGFVRKGNLKLTTLNLKQLSNKTQHDHAREIVTKEAGKPFDLETGPLFRYTLLRLNPSSHILILNMHHIISDGWSMSILFKELTTCYRAYLKNETPQLPELTIQYRDFSLWQKEWFQGGVMDSQLSYWKNKLAGSPSILELPTDRPRPAVQTHHGATELFSLQTDLSRSLKSLSTEQGCTLFMTLLTSFNILLYRYTGLTDILMGSPIAGRNREEIEYLIGFFVNTLVLRSDLSGNPMFPDLLKQIKETSLEAYANQDLPFEKLVEELQPVRSLSHHPLFQVMFVFQNMPHHPLSLPDLKIEPFKQDSYTAKFDLTLSLKEEGDKILGAFNYNSTLFNASTIKQLITHFKTLLAHITEEPKQKISSISLLSRSEKEKILIDWNNTTAPFPKEICTHELFERQVKKNPEAIAVVLSGKQLTFRELDDRSNQAAHYFISMGVGPEVLVGLYMERSLEMISVLLGILKAGGAYLLIEPDLPQKRIRFILDDSNTSLIVADSILPEGFSFAHKIIYWDKITLPFKNTKPQVSQRSDSLAYVIYTSGTSGNPKGTLIAHHSLVNYVSWLKAEFNFKAGDSSTWHSSVAFDGGYASLWGMLLHGGTLHLIPDHICKNPAGLSDYLIGHKISFLKITPVFFSLLMEDDVSNNSNPGFVKENSLKVIHLGGEAIIARDVETYLTYKPETVMINHYGPTETTIGAITHRVSPENIKEFIKRPLIGKPINNTRIYILDKQLNVVPIGVYGELHIAGMGLAREYLNRPELKKIKFIPNPFDTVSTSYIYKTGDLCRYLPDGNIEFSGRMDHQVKIQGFRIEPGEIETTLTRHSDIKEALVIAKEIALNDKRLVAYLVCDRNNQPLVSTIRDHMKQTLPNYMIPAYFVFLDKLPQTPNGKINRQALPEPDMSCSGSQRSYVPPRSPIEESISKIWSEVLGIPTVGIHDNFFDMGGHSLLAVSTVSQIRSRFKIKLPLADLFKSPTIYELAVSIQTRSFEQSHDVLVGIKVKGSKTPFFCVHPIGGTVFCYSELSSCLDDERPFYGLQYPGIFDEITLLTSIQDMASIYIDAMQSIQKKGPYYISGWSFGGIIAFEIARQLKQQGHEIALLALLDTYAPIQREQSRKITERDLIFLFVQDITNILGVNTMDSLNQLKQSRSEDLLIRLEETVNSKGIFPVPIKSGHLQSLFRLFRSNREAMSQYKPEPLCDKITLFYAGDNSGGIKNISAWNKYTKKGVEHYEIPGDHYSMMQKPNVQYLADQLTSCIQKTK